MSRLSLINQEVVHYDELVHGTAQMVTNNKGLVYKKRKIQVQENSIYSVGNKKLIDDTEEINEYTCECGNPEMIGRVFEGQICPICETPVKETFGADIDKNGWIDIGTYRVLQPIAYMKVKALIGKNFDKIINFVGNLNLEGKLVKEHDPKNPYNNIGLIEFYKHFEEIIMYFAKKKNKYADAEFLIKYKNRLFTSKIPVLSQQLRPAFINSNDKVFRYDPINQSYSMIIDNAVQIQNAMITNNTIMIDQLLYAIQSRLADLYTHILNKLNGKKKLLRGQIQGTRCSWSSRMVITANTGINFGLDHIVVSYKAFLELYQLEIINILKRGDVSSAFVDRTYYEIIDYLELSKYSNELDELLYSVMNYMIDNHHDGLWCLLNRPPTLDLPSIQCVKIVAVYPDPKVCSMGIPLTSLNGLNGDYDGDTLSLYSIKELCQAEEFIKGFNPKELCLDRTSSSKLYNSQFGLLKDFFVYLHDFLD